MRISVITSMCGHKTPKDITHMWGRHIGVPSGSSLPAPLQGGGAGTRGLGAPSAERGGPLEHVLLREEILCSSTGRFRILLLRWRDVWRQYLWATGNWMGVGVGVCCNVIIIILYIMFLIPIQTFKQRKGARERGEERRKGQCSYAL